MDLLGSLGLLAHVDDPLLGVGADHAGADRGKPPGKEGLGGGKMKN